MEPVCLDTTYVAGRVLEVLGATDGPAASSVGSCLQACLNRQPRDCQFIVYDGMLGAWVIMGAQLPCATETGGPGRGRGRGWHCNRGQPLRW